MKVFTLVVTMIAVAGLLLGSCYNSTRVRIPLQGSPASLDCHSACTSSTANGSDARFSCMAACPGARKSSGTCEAADLPPAGLCEQQREFSTWKSVALVAGVIVLLAFGAGGAGGGE